MTIQAYVGLPGSGKSYSAVKYVIEPAIATGRTVYTNIPFNSESFIEQYGTSPVYFETQDVIDNENWFFDVLPPGAVLVFDELWRLWPAGIKANQVCEAHKSFLAEHRHLVSDGFSTQIYFVTQDLSQIAQFARVLVEYTHRTTKLTMVGQKNRFRVDCYQGPVTGPQPPQSKRLKETFGKYDKSVFALYKSHTKSDGSIADESAVDDRFNVLKGSKWQIMAGVMCVGLMFVGWGIQKVQAYYAPVEPSDISPIPSSGFSVPLGSSNKVKTNHTKQLLPDVLKGLDTAIVFNRGNGKATKYVIEAGDSDSSFQLSSSELRDLGYKITPINNCFLLLSINGTQRTVGCAKEKEALFAGEINL